MITSTSTNFGVNPISLKSYDSAKIVVIQGMFKLDTANEDYLAAEQLKITFPDQSASQAASQPQPSSFVRRMTCRVAPSSRHNFKEISSSLRNCPSMTE